MYEQTIFLEYNKMLLNLRSFDVFRENENNCRYKICTKYYSLVIINKTLT